MKLSNDQRIICDQCGAIGPQWSPDRAVLFAHGWFDYWVHSPLGFDGEQVHLNFCQRCREDWKPEDVPAI